MHLLRAEAHLSNADVLVLAGAGARRASYRSKTWVRVLQRPVWCVGCNALSYAERVPSLREFEMAASVRRMSDRRRLADLDDELLQLSDEEFASLSRGLMTRRAPGHCLLCHGSDYAPLIIVEGAVHNVRHD